MANPGFRILPASVISRDFNPAFQNFGTVLKKYYNKVPEFSL
jgi:hypothetical protein